MENVSKISVIIPTLNEAENLEPALKRLGGADEVIVADGGSRDETQKVALRFETDWVDCSNATGRARQLNQGANRASGDILLFLHADTLLPAEGIADLRKTFHNDKEVIGGAFRRFFDSDSRYLKWTCRLANWRGQSWGVFLGDQAIFVRSKVFFAMGGFREDLPYGEDLDFSLRLRQEGRVVLLSPPVLSSARRFDPPSGPLQQTLKDLLLTLRLIRLREKPGF